MVHFNSWLIRPQCHWEGPLHCLLEDRRAVCETDGSTHGSCSLTASRPPSGGHFLNFMTCLLGPEYPVNILRLPPALSCFLCKGVFPTAPIPHISRILLFPSHPGQWPPCGLSPHPSDSRKPPSPPVTKGERRRETTGRQGSQTIS